MNLFAFSLYGQDPKYLVGAVENAEFISNSVEGWESIFYISEETPAKTRNQLIAAGAQIRVRTLNWHPNGMFWRFRAFLETEYDYIAVRDVDSRISQRELVALKQWVGSGKSAHIIRDHPLHEIQMLGGMWGARSDVFKDSKIWNRSLEYSTEHGQDQKFLVEHIYPIIRRDVLVHDTFFAYNRGALRNLGTRINREFIGETIDEFGNFERPTRELLMPFENSRVRRLYLLSVTRFPKITATARKMRDWIKFRELNKSKILSTKN